MSAVVEVAGLVRAFDGVRAVDGVSLTVKAGEIAGLLGHNGAGKTTTVRLLCGVLERDAGSVSVLGLDPKVAGDALRARVGVVTETHALDERFTGRENLAYFAALLGLDDVRARARIDELLAFFELAARGDDRVAGYSKGMKQKLAIARALLGEPDVLFLDEPTSGLDPVAAKKLSDHVRLLARERGTAVLFTTHRLVEAAELCDRVAILAKGRVVTEGTPREVITSVSGPAPLRLDVDDASRACALLVTAVGEGRVDVESGVVVVRGVARDEVPTLVERLVVAGVRVFGVAVEMPTLEDAYLALHRRAEEVSP